MRLFAPPPQKKGGDIFKIFIRALKRNGMRDLLYFIPGESNYYTFTCHVSGLSRVKACYVNGWMRSKKYRKAGKVKKAHAKIQKNIFIILPKLEI